MSERLDIRLSEKEKEKLAEIAKSKGVSMTELVREWITKGDIAFVLAEQLSDLVNDFARWHVLENRDSSILYLGASIRGRLGELPGWAYRMSEFFENSSRLVKHELERLEEELRTFVGETEAREKKELIRIIHEFSWIVEQYNRVHVNGYMQIFDELDEKSQSRLQKPYNDEFRVRYNEFAAKYEDFLKRASRELGENLSKAIPRAKELRARKTT